MRFDIACSLLGILCGAPAQADDFCKPHTEYEHYDVPAEASVSDLSRGTPEQVRQCILEELKQQREAILDNIQKKSKDLADVNSLIERWSK